MIQILYLRYGTECLYVWMQRSLYSFCLVFLLLPCLGSSLRATALVTPHFSTRAGHCCGPLHCWWLLMWSPGSASLVTLPVSLRASPSWAMVCQVVQLDGDSSIGPSYSDWLWLLSLLGSLGRSSNRELRVQTWGLPLRHLMVILLWVISSWSHSWQLDLVEASLARDAESELELLSALLDMLEEGDRAAEACRA